MRWLVSLSLRHAVVVLALAVIGTLAAARGARNIPLDVFPEFAPPLVEIQTEAPGLSTPEVESLISVPVESALAGVPGVKTISSKSVLGLSSVVLILEGDADRMAARQHVQERLGTIAAQLPVSARSPVMLSPCVKCSGSSRLLAMRQLTTTQRTARVPRWCARDECNRWRECNR